MIAHKTLAKQLKFFLRYKVGVSLAFLNELEVLLYLFVEHPQI